MEEKKTTPRNAPLSEGQHKQKDKAFKEALEAGKKENITLFPEFDGDTEARVTINGVDFIVKKGEEVEVPAPVAALLRDNIKLRQEIAAFEKANKGRHLGIL